VIAVTASALPPPHTEGDNPNADSDQTLAYGGLGHSGGEHRSALPFTGVLRRFRWAAILTGLVLLECGVLAVNGGRCPLSDLAQRFTHSHANNFDIYLPNWLAQYNKVIFGVLFIAGELVVLGCWLRERFSTESRPLEGSFRS
jgi:hypothetical protein